MENLNKYIENNFQGHLSKLVDLSDGQLRTEDGFAFPIHRFVLATKSQYFFALFCGTEKNKKDALIPGVQGEVLSSILTYIYTREIRVTDEYMCDLFIAADYLLLEDLLLHMKTVLSKKLCVANSFAILTAASKTNSGDLFKKSLRIVEIHFEDIMRGNNEAFYQLPLEALKQLLSKRNLRIKNENVIWDAIVEWVSACFPHRLPCVPDLLLCLSLAEVNESLAKEILQHDFVASNTSCQEICGLKSTNPELSNYQILQHYVQNSPNPNSLLYARRNPPNLQLVAHYYAKDVEICTEIYVTYDEKFDLWCKILDVDIDTDNLLAVNDCIYMLDERLVQPLIRFSITEKRWLPIGKFRNRRYHCMLLKLNGLIYNLGGYSEDGNDAFDVEIYDPEGDTWYDTAPMPPVSEFGAVTFNGSIYVVGNNSKFRKWGEYEMIAQVYNSDTEIWNVLPQPAVYRSYCVLAAYHEKLYLISGRFLLDHDSYHNCKKVEVFNPANNIWSRAADLPYAYCTPEVVVINDQMIVYDMIIKPADPSFNPSVVWNEKNECWETIEGSFSSTNLYMCRFFPLEDVEYVNVVAKENKDPETVFEKCPFS